MDLEYQLYVPKVASQEADEDIPTPFIFARQTLSITPTPHCSQR